MLALTKRDEQILEIIASFGYCQERHICLLHDISAKYCSKIVKRLIDANYLVKQKVLAYSQAYLFLTKVSCRLLNLKSPSSVVLNTLKHDTMLIDLYFYFKQNRQYLTIQTDKELRRIYGYKENIRVPDLLIDEVTAIELELTEKTTTRLENIVNSYIVSDSIKIVEYYLTSKTLAQKIYKLALHPKFKFYLFDYTDNKISNLSLYVDEFKIMDSEFSYNDKGEKVFGNFVL